MLSKILNGFLKERRSIVIVEFACLRTKL